MASPSPPAKEKETHSHDHHHHHAQEDELVPWFPDPMNGWHEHSESFAPRHEASTIELFFDLWFVANLATFTQYHAITNRNTFWSYVAFFIIIWTTWFHVVAFDARFTSDSVWERACKVVHFCTFAGFALVGYKFAPAAQNGQDATPRWVYRTLVWALFISRIWLAFQYLMTLILCSTRRHRHLRLTLPLAMNALLFACVAAVFGGLFAGFRDENKNITGVLAGLYVTVGIEFVTPLIISMMWRKLSFQATHISERLGLLGLIIIGEGVIGTTKTITRTMGKSGPTWQASAQVFCIVMILVFMWILYFDNIPKKRYGHYKHQIWMALHLPFHLSILGVVEGSQQLAQATYIYQSAIKLVMNSYYACVKSHLDGQPLATNLTKNLEYFKINESAEGTLALPYVYNQIYFLGNATGACSPANTSDVSNEWRGLPITFAGFFNRAFGALYHSFGIDLPLESDTSRGFNIAVQSWHVVYIYFFSAMILLFICFMITSLLADSEKNCRTWRSYITLANFSRASMIGITIALLVLGAKNGLFLQEFIASELILPAIVLKLWMTCVSDRSTKLWRRRKQRKQKEKQQKGYQSVATDSRDINALTEGVSHESSESNESGTTMTESSSNGDHHWFHVKRRATNAYGYPSHGARR